MRGDKEIQAILKAVDEGITDWDEALPGIQEQIYLRILIFQKELVIQGNTVTNSAKNIRLLADLRTDLESIILNDTDYLESVTKFAKLFEKVEQLNNNYFKALEREFKPPKIVAAIRQQSVSLVLDSLTEAGLNANLINPVREIIQTYVTTGGSYARLTKELNNYINGYESPQGRIDGQLQRYSKQIVNDSINQYTATVNEVLTADLGWEWYRYVGSNLKTTRTFCKALTEKQYYHKSELPQIIKGNFDEFKKMKGKIYDKTGLPQGMIEDTNINNFVVYRGGYNCGHQAYGIPTALVPAAILNSLPS